MPELKMFGITDRLLEHGTPKELQHECGYDVAVIKEIVLVMIKGKISTSVFH